MIQLLRSWCPAAPCSCLINNLFIFFFTSNPLIFQVVSLLHALLTNEDTDIKTALVVCPVSTVLNWVNEFDKWLKDVGSGQDIEVYHMAK